LYSVVLLALIFQIQRS